MIAELEQNVSHLSGEINHRRLLKKFDRQVAFMLKHRLFQPAGMKQREFAAQVAELREKLQVREFDVGGNISIVTCLPPAHSLMMRMQKMPFQHKGNVCACKMDELKQTVCPTRLHALVGVNDGCSMRLTDVNGRRIHCGLIRTLTGPQTPLTVWACIDMACHYPSLLNQQGFVCGGSLVRNRATALWTQNGTLMFGDTASESFRRSRNTRWGVPSFQELVVA